MQISQIVSRIPLLKGFDIDFVVTACNGTPGAPSVNIIVQTDEPQVDIKSEIIAEYCSSTSEIVELQNGKELDINLIENEVEPLKIDKKIINEPNIAVPQTDAARYEVKHPSKINSQNRNVKSELSVVHYDLASALIVGIVGLMLGMRINNKMCKFNGATAISSKLMQKFTIPIITMVAALLGGAISVAVRKMNSSDKPTTLS